MDLLLDLYGFASVLLHAAALVARTALLGSVAFWLALALPLGRRLPAAEAARLGAIARRAVLLAGAAAFGLTLLTTTLTTLVLQATLQAPLAGALGADFARAGAAALLATVLLVGLSLPRRAPGAARQAALALAALALLAAATATSHAMARVEGRGALLAATALHQLGAALWLGGLPALLAALRLPAPAARRVGRRYSALAATGVGLILLGIAGFWGGYFGGVEALYGTAYGAMSSTKAVLLGLLLLLGLANFLLLHAMAPSPRSAGAAAVGGGDGGLRRLRRFVECEIALGIGVLAVAGSLTSVPPAVDLPEDRLAWSEIRERFTPRPPRLTSPDHGDLAIPALQAQLDAEWQRRQDAQQTRPLAFTPGEGLLPPLNAQDIAWSEYNHHWAGLVVLLVGLAALLDATGRVPWAQHWPLLFLALSAFIIIRGDPDTWPLGPIPFLDGLRNPETLQHKLLGLLVAGFALSEWAVRLGWLGGGARYVFPLSMLTGGVLLLSHTHALANYKEALLIELSHLPLAVFALVAGCARWTELRGPRALAVRARWIWPVCLLLTGYMLVTYREA
ncbi:CopD family protein [Crenalkalicoccus roseus]|uniref:CopD family protein n=1 Tax=Crenalkalicoccus roseus TaxID=1485588 RepID=UPI001082179F|nr:CopD family protein [Crenalkalicoccus roseus]